jgi:hypothetical protein
MTRPAFNVCYGASETREMQTAQVKSLKQIFDYAIKQFGIT